MSKALSVQDRGGFFDDPFFRDSWADFDFAVQRVLDRFDGPASYRREGGGRSESNDAYRTLRSARGDEDADMYATQALQVTERDGRFQVVMDVREFNPRNLQVRAVEDNRIVVEGKYQQVSPDGSSSAWKTFSKEFTLPDEADIDLVTTALSKDGVLTIRAPRRAGTESSPCTPRPKTSTVQSINESFNEQRTQDGGVATNCYKSTSSATNSSSSSAYKASSSTKGIQSSSSFESCDSGLDSLPRDIRDRLMVNESTAQSSVSSSNNNSTCSSPVPSEAASDVSRVSTSMQFDIGSKERNDNMQRSEVTFNVGAHGKEGLVRSPTAESQTPTERMRSPDEMSSISSASSRYSTGSRNNKMDRYGGQSAMFAAPARPPTFTAGCGSSGDASVTVEEKDGRRTVTSEKSNVIHEKNGILESREIAAEIDEKDGQSARREAITRINRSHEDPEGRFREAEKAEAADVSESCVKKLSDGTLMSMKKSSTSSSSHKSFSSSSGGGGAVSAFNDPFFDVGFGSDFGDLRSLMGRGHSLMSQMSTDSMASTLSGRSGYSDRSQMSERSNASSRSNMSDRSNMSERSTLSDRSSASTQSQRSGFSERSRGSEANSRYSDAADANMRLAGGDRFGGFNDRVSLFPERASMFPNRASLSDRFPNFTDSMMADFDDFPQMQFPEFPSMGGSSFSRSSRNSNNNSFSSSSSFGSGFDGKY